MTIFKKGKTWDGKELIACIEEKAVFMADGSGKIYKQFPRQHLKEEQFIEEVEFPGNYEDARKDFTAKQGSRQREFTEEEKAGIAAQRKRWYEERKQEVLAVRRVRNMAFDSAKVIFHQVLAFDMEFSSNDGNWYPTESTYSHDTKKIFFWVSDAEKYYEELKTVKLEDGSSPVQIEWLQAEVDSEDILSVVDYEGLKELWEGADFETRESCMVRPEYKSIEGSVIVVWSWEPYVGYARKFRELRLGYSNETEEDLITGNEERVIRPNLSLVLSKEDLEGLDEDGLRETLEDALFGDWKWRNPASVTNAIEDLIEEIIRKR